MTLLTFRTEAAVQKPRIDEDEKLKEMIYSIYNYVTQQSAKQQHHHNSEEAQSGSSRCVFALFCFVFRSEAPLYTF